MKPKSMIPNPDSSREKFELMGQIASSVAHDINNMLTIIIGEAKLLELKIGGNPYLNEHVESINRAVMRASQLTYQLLHFGRKQNNEFIPITLYNLFQDIHLILQHIVGEQITIQLNISEDLPPIEMNRDLIEQAIINVILNARDAMPNGGIINIEANVLQTPIMDAQQDQVAPFMFAVLKISDNGFGMSPEVKDRAFDPYFTTKPKNKGTGLGLYNVREIVKLHGGFVDLASEVGVGTTVSLCLPITQIKVFSKKKQF
ncbi:MAG: ATP-binding protein [bacterium]|nr:ATP-binding protein [bacterium]